ncbi:hypothetical protein C2E23DRAFT_886226 [Lenzites betulinus]|nr:hypothetical protein C2E23DRAFT_886226 [Lenzites betulinus]
MGVKNLGPSATRTSSAPEWEEGGEQDNLESQWGLAGVARNSDDAEPCWSSNLRARVVFSSLFRYLTSTAQVPMGRRTAASQANGNPDNEADQDEALPSEADYRPPSKRVRQPSQRQAELDTEKAAHLAKQMKNLQKKYDKLKRQKTQKTVTTSTNADGNEESSSESSPGPESEDEPEDLVAEWRHKSSFESRGIFSTEPPRKRLRRRGDPPPSSPAPTSSAASGTDTRAQDSSRASSRSADSASQADSLHAYSPRPRAASRMSSSDVDLTVAATSQRITRSLSRSPHPYRNAPTASANTGLDDHDMEYSDPLPRQADRQGSSSHDKAQASSSLRGSRPRSLSVLVKIAASTCLRTMATMPPVLAQMSSVPIVIETVTAALPARPWVDATMGSAAAPERRFHDEDRPDGGRVRSRASDCAQSPPPSAPTTTAAATAADPPFLNGHAPSGKPKAGDYENHVNKLIVLACHRYEVLIATDTPFPDTEKQNIWAARAWAEACAGAQVAYRCTDRISKIITGRGSHARGTLRDKIRPLVATTYGLFTDGTERAKAKNIARYAYLLDRDSAKPEPVFHYKDVDTAAGFAHNSIVLSAIKAEWFAEPTGPGVKYMAEFAPIREVTLALIFTAIEFCLDQWADGSFKQTAFSEKVYGPKYDAHLKQVQDWSAGDLNASRIVRQRMYDRARRASGAAPPAAPAAGLAAASRDRLRLELAAQAAADDEDD